MFDWPKDGSLLAPVNGQVTKACLLSRPGEALKVESDANGIRVTMPKEKPDPIANVVALDIEGMTATSLLRPAADGSIRLTAADAEICGSHLMVEGSGPVNLGYWIDADDYATWTFRVEKAGAYSPELIYSAAPGYSGSRIELAAGNGKSAATIAQTAGWSDYKLLRLSPLNLNAGNVTITLKATHMAGGAVMNLRSIVLKPAIGGKS